MGLKEQYLSLCKDFGEKPFKGKITKDLIGQHLSMTQEFCEKIESLLNKT